MVKVKKNLLLTGLVGALNKQFVLKQYGSVTVISAYPDMSKVVKTDKQRKENHKFRQAMAYARSQMADPVSKAEYKAKAKGLQKPHNVAMADFYHPPEIKNIDLTGFHGQKNDVIIIHAIDDFKVVRVTVSISDSKGTVLETGEALQLTKWKWKYKVENEYDTADTLQMTATAWDKPGNMARAEILNYPTGAR